MSLNKRTEAATPLTADNMKQLLDYWAGNDFGMEEAIERETALQQRRLVAPEGSSDFIRAVFNGLLLRGNITPDKIWETLDDLNPPETLRNPPRFFRNDVDPDTLSDEDLHPHHLPEQAHHDLSPEDDDYDPFLHGASVNCRSLLRLAQELEDPNHEALVAAENDPEVLEVVASALVKAASALRVAAEVVEFAEEPLLTPEKLDEMAAVAASFEESGDELLQKQASVLDDFLHVLASPEAKRLFRKESREVTHRLDKALDDPTGGDPLYRDQWRDSKIVQRATQAIKDSPVYETYRPLQQALATRGCPDHPGYGLIRLGEGEYQCPLDKKIYNYHNGYEDLKGNKVPGTRVEEQNVYDAQYGGATTEDSRLDRMGLKH